MKDNVKVLFWLTHIVAWPFLIGAAFHFVGEWLGWPMLLVGGVFWLGSAILIAEHARK